MRTPAEDAERLADELRALAARLRAAEAGEAMFTRGDLDRLVERRLARERKKRRKSEQEVANLQAEVEELRRRVHAGTPAPP